MADAVKDMTKATDAVQAAYKWLTALTQSEAYKAAKESLETFSRLIEQYNEQRNALERVANAAKEPSGAE